MLRRALSWKFTNVLEVLTACLTELAMEAVSTSETSVNLYESIRNIPKGSILHTRRCENLKRYVIVEERIHTEDYVVSILFVMEYSSHISERESFRSEIKLILRYNRHFPI
jgi:hypothetical protein